MMGHTVQATETNIIKREDPWGVVLTLVETRFKSLERFFYFETEPECEKLLGDCHSFMGGNLTAQGLVCARILAKYGDPETTAKAMLFMNDVYLRYDPDISPYALILLWNLGDGETRSNLLSGLKKLLLNLNDPSFIEFISFEHELFLKEKESQWSEWVDGLLIELRAEKKSIPYDLLDSDSPFLADVLLDGANPHQFFAASVLLDEASTPVNKKDQALGVIKTIAQKRGHPCRVNALHCLLYRVKENPEGAVDDLYKMLTEKTFCSEQEEFNIAEILFRSDYSKDRKDDFLKIFMKAVEQKNDGELQWKAAEILYYHTISGKESGLAVFRRVATNKYHPHYKDAKRVLEKIEASAKRENTRV